jgi:peroxidase
LMGAPTNARVAGDVRANENIALTSVHTLFAREHNRIVRALPDSLDQEVKFEIARRLVSAEQQFITYNEFLPALGVKLNPYDGYKPGINSSLSNEFAVVGYRAHSMIHGEIEVLAKVERYTPEQLEQLQTRGVEIEAGEGKAEFAVPLNVAFGNPDLVEEIGLGPILVGLGSEAQYKNDEQIDNQLRSVLFQIPGPGVADPHECLDGPELSNCFSTVVDLGAVDIARGRDHGMPYYNDMRKAYGLLPKGSFAAITNEATEEFPNDPEIDAANPLDDPSILDIVALRDIDGNVQEPGSEEGDEGAVTEVRRTTVAARLKALYGDVNKVDAFVGMVAEPHLPGTEFGELQLAMWKQQFEALRDGDRFFYPNDPALRTIEQKFGLTYRHRLADIIALNTELEHGNIQPNLFKLGRGPARFRGTRLSDEILGFSGPDRIRSGSGDDVVRGGRGKDVIAAGSGSDKVWGGKDSDRIRALGGGDWIDVRDGARDWVNCGKGQDAVMADGMDRVAANCETVKRKR